jgi:hypothetical protein
MGLLRLGRPAPLGARSGHRLDAHRVRARRLVAAPGEPKRRTHDGDRLQLVLRKLRRERRRLGRMARGSRPLPLPRPVDPSLAHVPERANPLAPGSGRRRGRLRRGDCDAGLAERDRDHRSLRAARRRVRTPSTSRPSAHRVGPDSGLSGLPAVSRSGSPAAQRLDWLSLPGRPTSSRSSRSRRPSAPARELSSPGCSRPPGSGRPSPTSSSSSARAGRGRSRTSSVRR